MFLKEILSKTIVQIIGAVILGVLIMGIYNKIFYDDYVETRTVTEYVVDSTAVDSLTQRITYLESLPPIIKTDTLKIPVPVENDDSTYTYNFPYQDSVLTANWIANTMGEVDFKSVTLDYKITRERRVVENTVYVTETVYKTRTETITKTPNPKPYLTAGFEAGTNSNISPSLGFMTRKQYHIRYRYNLNDGSHNVGISIPLKLF